MCRRTFNNNINHPNRESYSTTNNLNRDNRFPMIIFSYGLILPPIPFAFAKYFSGILFMPSVPGKAIFPIISMPLYRQTSWNRPNNARV